MANQDKIQFIEALKIRFKKYVVQSIYLFRLIPKTEEGKIFGRQFLRSVSSAGSNYRAACRARSAKEFYAKISIINEELDESLFWMEILVETEILEFKNVEKLVAEGSELMAIVSKARKSTFK